MKRVLGREDIEQTPDGGRVAVPPGTIVTPLARDYADEHGIDLVADVEEVPAVAPTPVTDEDEAMVAVLAGEVVRSLLGSEGAPTPAAGLTPLGLPEATTAARHLAQCVVCPNSVPDPASGHRGVVSATGRNKPGIVARLSADIAECGVDILDMSQTIVAGFFTMILVVDTRGLADLHMTFADFRDRIATAAVDLGCEITVMHEKVLQSMQRL